MAHTIKIMKGHNGGDCFWIMPVKCHPKGDSLDYDDVTEERKFEISICEDDVDCFLYAFFSKYFDLDLKWNKIRAEGMNTEEFEWNLEHNFYTYETIDLLLEDMRKVIGLLKTDYDNPYPKPFKKNYRLSYMIDEERNFGEKMYLTDAQEQQLIRENIGVVIDFYERFILELSEMMKQAPDYDLISAMGP